MHGRYDSLYWNGNDARDLRKDDIDIKRLGANFRFASDKVSAQNPWAQTALNNGDFILIAEFSENVGPLPVVSKFVVKNNSSLINNV